MNEYVAFLARLNLITRACCCGHGRYAKTVIIETRYIMGVVKNYELFTGRVIPRKRRFYVKDNDGYFFIPELLKK